jgi:hypothetical protein
MTWPLRALRWIYCAFIAWSSVQTFIEARRVYDTHALLLSLAELAAIVAFLFRALEIPALVILIAVFAIAATMTSLAGELPLRFLFFGATAAFIVCASRLRTEISSPPAA